MQYTKQGSIKLPCDISIPRVREDSSLIEGIKMLFNFGLGDIAVEDKTGKIVGRFSLKHIKDRV